MAANMVGRNEAPAVGFGAPTSQFGRPQSAGFGQRPGTGASCPALCLLHAMPSCRPRPMLLLSLMRL